jgi:hypothetical protein
MLVAVAGLMIACGSSSSGPSPTTVGRPAATTTTGATTAPGSPSATTGTSVPATGGASPTQPFASASYHYTVASTGWAGTDAKKRWDGTGLPGNSNPTVDVLDGPQGVEAYAFGEPTSDTLRKFVADARIANAKAHPCSTQMPSTTTMTVDGAPAVLDSGYCPPPGGPFVILAYVVHSGRAYVFFTVSIPPGSEQFTRNWFLPLLREIRFTD